MSKSKASAESATPSSSPPRSSSSPGSAAALARAGADLSRQVEQWIKDGNATAVAEVAQFGSGAARKAARRGLNVLRSRGITVDAPRRVATLGKASSERIEEAWMLSPDSTGTLLLVVTAHSVSSRYHAAFVVLNNERGLERVELGEMSQSQLREAMNANQPGVRYKAVKVPVAWARYRIAEARKRVHELGRPEPLGLTSARDLLEPAPETAPEHPFDAEGLELSDDDAREYAKASSKLHNLPEFAGWFPPKSAVDELLGKVGEHLTPGQEPDESVFKPLLEEQIDQATDRHFSPQRRAALASAMKDGALSVLSRDGEGSALEVVGTMKIMEQAGLITDPPHEIPFLRGFFEKAINLLLIQGGGRLRIPIRGAPPGDAPSGEPGPDPDQGSSEDSPA